MSPKLSCVNVTAKYLLFGINLLFALLGLAILIIGIAVQVKLQYVTKALGNVHMAPVGVIVLGAVIFVIAFFGCCGAIKENSCLLITFGCIMVALMVIKIIAAVIIFTQMAWVLKEISPAIDEHFAKKSDFTSLESNFKCCGAEGPTSYKTSLPDSCCPSNVHPCKADKAYEGCKTVLKHYFKVYGNAAGIIIIAIAVIELIAAIMAIRLALAIRKNKSSPTTPGPDAQ